MSTLRFTRVQLVAALEARRPWAERVDAERLSAHQRDEREFLTRFRFACREAAKWDYETAKGPLLRGMGGSVTEPVVIEMTDEAAGLVVRAIGIAVTVNDLAVSYGGDSLFSDAERSALVATEAAIREMSL